MTKLDYAKIRQTYHEYDVYVVGMVTTTDGDTGIENHTNADGEDLEPTFYDVIIQAYKSDYEQTMQFNIIDVAEDLPTLPEAILAANQAAQMLFFDPEQYTVI